MELSSKKIIETLILLEQAGNKFYSEIALYSKPGKGQKLFERLAADEKKHEEFYKGLLETVPSEWDKLKELDYLNSLIDSNFFVNNKEFMDDLKVLKSKSEVLNIAEQLEKDTLTFLNELVATNPDINTQEIQMAIEEERRHLRDILKSQADSELEFFKAI